VRTRAQGETGYASYAGYIAARRSHPTAGRCRLARGSGKASLPSPLRSEVRGWGALYQPAKLPTGFRTPASAPHAAGRACGHERVVRLPVCMHGAGAWAPPCACAPSPPAHHPLAPPNYDLCSLRECCNARFVPAREARVDELESCSHAGRTPTRRPHRGLSPLGSDPRGRLARRGAGLETHVRGDPAGMRFLTLAVHRS
jgi:hypothetical protein